MVTMAAYERRRAEAAAMSRIILEYMAVFDFVIIIINPKSLLYGNYSNQSIILIHYIDY